jgi:hypothetical protein
MNIKCTIIEDLLPLYADGICSEDTKELVEAHLMECDSCNQKYKNMTSMAVNQELISENNEKLSDLNLRKDEIVSSFTAKKAFKRLRRRLLALILCILFLIPNIYLGINQAGGEGISYTNIGILYKTHAMLSEIKRGNYEKAFSYIDLEGRYQDLTTPEDIKSLEDIYSMIRIGDTDYYAKKEIMTYYYQYESDQDELAFWSEIYFSNKYIIPAQQYEQLLKNDPELGEKNAQEAYVDLGNGPESISSTYGGYYIPYHFKNSSGTEEGDEMLTGLAREADILPMQVYEAALEQEKKNEEEQAKVRQKYIDIGYESYAASCTANFVNNMQKLSDRGVTVAGMKLRGIYYVYDGSYQLDYDILFQVDGTTVRGFGLVIRSSQGKLDFSGSYSETDSAGEKLDDEYNLTSTFYSYSEYSGEPVD